MAPGSRPGSCGYQTTLLCVFHGEADPERHLIEVDLAVLDLPAGLHHLEPAQVAHRLAGARDGIADRVLDSRLGRTDEVDDLVDMIVHGGLRAWGRANVMAVGYRAF